MECTQITLLSVFISGFARSFPKEAGNGDSHSESIMAAITVGTVLSRHEIECNEVMPIRVRLLTILLALCEDVIL